MNISQQTLDMLQEEGYDSLNDYLECLAMDYNVSKRFVDAMAELLGEDELMDGLCSACMDAEGLY